MKNYIITKEQLRSLTDPKAKEMFPEAFKENLEVGKWYKNISQNWLMNYQGGISNYVWNSNNHFDNFYIMDNISGWKLATDKEVQDMLEEEAIRRGYTTENTKCLIGLGKQKVTGNFHYESVSNRLYSAGNGKGGRVLFEGGKWAEIIKTITKEEAEKRLGLLILD